MANEISCLKFEKTWANEHFERHNFRVVSPEYLLKNHAHENEYRTIFDPRSEYEKIDFSNKRGRKIEYAHSIREAVLLVKDGTTIKDIESAVKKIEDTLEIKCCSIAIHNDEGHVDKDSGQTIYNTHAHLVFYTLDKDGKQNFRLTKIRPKLSKLQQDLADELHMIKPKVNSKRKGLSHAEFREVQEQLEEQKDLDKKRIDKLTRNKTVLSNYLSDIATELEVPKDENNKFKLQDIKNKVKALNADDKLRKKDISTVCETVRKAVVGTGVPKEFYRDLGAIKKSDLKEVQELQQALIKLLDKYESSLKDKDKEILNLKDKNAVLSNQEPVVKEVPRELTADEIKKTEPYQNLLTQKEALENEVKTLADSGLVTFAEKDDCFEIIDKVKTVLSKPQQPKIKEVPRALNTSEIEELPRVKQLKQELDNTHKYYLKKPNDFTFEVSFEDLKQCTNSFGLLKKELAESTVKRINKQIEAQITPIIQNNKALKHNNTVLSKDNKDLKKENIELKGFKAVALKLLQEVGYFWNKVPTVEQAVSSVKEFGSKLFSAFIMNNDRDLELVQTKIINGQEFKLQQIEKKQQQEQSKDIEKELEKSMGFSHHDQEEERGGRSR